MGNQVQYISYKELIVGKEVKRANTGQPDKSCIDYSERPDKGGNQFCANELKWKSLGSQNKMAISRRLETKMNRE